MIDWNAVLPREWSRILPWIGVSAAALIGAGWALFSFGYSRGKDVAQDQLAYYENTTAAKLPEVGANLLKISNDLRDGLRVYEENKTLRTKVRSYQDQIAEATKHSATLDVIITDLRKKTAEDTMKQGELRDQIHALTGDLTNVLSE